MAGKSVLQTVKPRQLWTRSPAVTRLVVMGSLLLSLCLPRLGDLVSVAPKVLLCCIHTIFRSRYVWAVCLSWIYKPAQDFASCFLVLMDVYLAIIYFPRKERQMGSFGFLIWLLYVNTCINLIFLMMMLVLANSNDAFETQCNQGLWPMLLVIITRRALKQPSKRFSFLNAVRMHQRWYPLALGALLTGINLRHVWKMIAAFTFGYLDAKVEKYYLSTAVASSLNRVCLGGMISKGMRSLGNMFGVWIPSYIEPACGDYSPITPLQRWGLFSHLPMVVCNEEGSGTPH